MTEREYRARTREREVQAEEKMVASQQVVDELNETVGLLVAVTDRLRNISAELIAEDARREAARSKESQ